MDMFDITIVGLGYVGLPLLKRCLSRNFNCAGIDIDVPRIEKLKKGESVIHNIDVGEFKEAVKSGKLFLTTSFDVIAKSKAAIICLPTPLTKQQTPDLSYVEASIREIVKHAKKGILVVLESTTYPGTTDDILKPVLEEALGVAGKDFYLGYSPEREDPGNPLSDFDHVPKVISGCTKQCQEKVLDLYSKICKQLVPVSSCSAAEMTKVWENTFRAINISAVNELKMICDRMGIDVWEVVDAAKTKPYGFTAFYPGPGMGGHCIPVDPFYLTWKAKEFDMHTRFIELAGEINFRMHQYVADKVDFALNDQRKSVKGSKVLVIGITYKANIDDMRESPSFPIMEKLQAKGAHIDYHDPYVPEIPHKRHFKGLQGKLSVKLDAKVVSSYDVCVLLTLHNNLPYSMIAENAQCIVDARNGMKGFNVKGNLYKA
jgi:UDP-N-acetyl-D-glucosamine dehydrogenase